MEPYIQTMKAAFPKAELALVGHEFHGGRSAIAWNEEVFNSTTANYTGLEAHAATVHIYTIVKSAGINNATLSYRAPELLQSAWAFPSAQSPFLEATIPARYKIWVTEMGSLHYSP